MEQRSEEKYIAIRSRSVHIGMLILITLSLPALIAAAVRWEWRETWMLPFLVAGTGAGWVLHIRQLFSVRARRWYYALLSWAIILVAGVHPVTLFSIAGMTVLYLVVFSQTPERLLMHIGIILFAFLLICQGMTLMSGDTAGPDVAALSQLIVHTAIVIAVYILSLNIMHRRDEDRASDLRVIRELDEMRKRTENFMTNVSHELRTPVNVVTGLSSVMQTRLQNEEDREDAAHILNAGIRLSDQVDDMLDYTEIETGRFTGSREPYMITSVVNDMVSELDLAHRKNVPDVIVDMDASLPSRLVGDARRIKKVLYHLTDNALKFTAHGGVYINIYQNPQAYGINLCIEIRDTGMGMSPETLERIREGIYQEDAGRDRENTGFGLGLRIVYGIVHAMDGFVRIESAPGRGTTVHVTIPQEVYDASYALSVPHPEKLKIAFYQRQDKFDPAIVSAWYLRMIGHVIQSFSLVVQRVSTLEDLKRMLNDQTFTHLFIADDEYVEEPSYFDALTEHIHVAMVERGVHPAKPSRRVTIMKKPFYVLPLVEVLNAPDERAAKIALGAEEEVRFDDIDALVVDDEEMNLLVAQGIFREYGMLVDVALSGQQAIDLVRKNDYHIIFMDHMMPGMDGVEAAHRIRDVLLSANRKTKIVALTANAVSGAREMFLREGFDGFLAKPIERRELTRVLRRVISGEETDR